MSKADITAVATLAAHLAKRWHKPHEGACYAPHDVSAEQAASDAMQLQRLGRRTGRHITKCDAKNGIYWRGDVEHERIEQQAHQILAPYGLDAEIDAIGLVILGLPSNTPGTDRFCI